MFDYGCEDVRNEVRSADAFLATGGTRKQFCFLRGTFVPRLFRPRGGRSREPGEDLLDRDAQAGEHRPAVENVFLSPHGVVAGWGGYRRLGGSVVQRPRKLTTDD